ncbi:MAG: hypothetical protein GC203_08880 [Phenylobacterium sp.]|uniref:hypothetical protein n=1 Tax=Phenylobacterium sp. TaxID=1871053 RepID=UPI0025FFE269|nr:hypothetical protein [Phenylobacterium sp.]MBI1197965.1 hypothetical protein [Phenylobacterium sp.]
MTVVADPYAMLSALSGCAYRLGMAFGDEAERVDDWDRRLELFQLFDRCFFSVRVATALRMRLRREAAAPERLRETESLRDREDRAEPAERMDSDRERESERASLPILLKTLNGVADDAADLPGPPPAELLTLRELLARTTGDTPRPTPPRGTLRARLAGSSVAAVTLPPRKTSGLATRPATGPPRA